MLNTGYGPQRAFDKCYSHFCHTREQDAIKENTCLPLTIAAKTSQPTSPAIFTIACMFGLLNLFLLSAIVWPRVSSDAGEVKQWRLHCSMKNKH